MQSEDRSNVKVSEKVEANSAGGINQDEQDNELRRRAPIRTLHVAEVIVMLLRHDCPPSQAAEPMPN